MKIKGLGPATIEKIGLSDICEIYSLDLHSLTKSLSSEKLAQKLLDEIDKSKNASMNQVLPAFSIPLIGKTATDKLSKNLKSFLALDEYACTASGLGPKATDNLMNFFKREFYKYETLPFSFVFDKAPEVAKNTDVVCITGKLKSFKTKAEAEKALLEKGYSVKSTLTKQVTILINESGLESSKTKTARESGIKIVNNLMEIL